MPAHRMLANQKQLKDVVAAADGNNPALPIHNHRLIHHHTPKIRAQSPMVFQFLYLILFLVPPIHHVPRQVS